jgi:hypothetical protein
MNRPRCPIRDAGWRKNRKISDMVGREGVDEAGVVRGRGGRGNNDQRDTRGQGYYIWIHSITSYRTKSTR